ncbi:MAG: response regulator [Candidatus Acidiferrum sp.]
MRKILIVDDDSALRRLMRIELGDTYEVIDSGEPEQGLALALEHRPDAILIDLRMPKYSGYELVQTYTSFSQTQAIPLIIVSGEAGSQTKEHCKKLGAIAYFEKPIDFDALRTCLAEVTKRRKHHPPRTEVRVHLNLLLKLRGLNGVGNPVEESVTTENVSLGGFAWNTKVDFPMCSTVDVYMSGFNNAHVGKAQVLQVEDKSGARHYLCRFLEKPREWVLQ